MSQTFCKTVLWPVSYEFLAYWRQELFFQWKCWLFWSPGILSDGAVPFIVSSFSRASQTDSHPAKHSQPDKMYCGLYFAHPLRIGKWKYMHQHASTRFYQQSHVSTSLWYFWICLRKTQGAGCAQASRGMVGTKRPRWWRRAETKKDAAGRNGHTSNRPWNAENPVNGKFWHRMSSQQWIA